MTYQRVMLKVCEGCGTLWIRKQTGSEVYCGPCTAVFEQFPDPKTRRRPGRPKKGAGQEYPDLLAMPSLSMAGGVQ